MNTLPLELENIILDYKNQLEETCEILKLKTKQNELKEELKCYSERLNKIRSEERIHKEILARYKQLYVERKQIKKELKKTWFFSKAHEDIKQILKKNHNDISDLDDSDFKQDWQGVHYSKKVWAQQRIYEISKRTSVILSKWYKVAEEIVERERDIIKLENAEIDEEQN